MRLFVIVPLYCEFIFVAVVGVFLYIPRLEPTTHCIDTDFCLLIEQNVSRSTTILFRGNKFAHHTISTARSVVRNLIQFYIQHICMTQTDVLDQIAREWHYQFHVIFNDESFLIVCDWKVNWHIPFVSVSVSFCFSWIGYESIYNCCAKWIFKRWICSNSSITVAAISTSTPTWTSARNEQCRNNETNPIWTTRRLWIH